MTLLTSLIVDTIDIVNIVDTHFDTVDVIVTLLRQSETIIDMDSVVIRKYEKCYFLHQWDLRDASASKNKTIKDGGIAP